MLPDDLWNRILAEWLQNAVDWSHFSQTCKQFYGFPRPRPLQLVTSRGHRFPHVLFLEEVVKQIGEDGKEEEQVELFCFNSFTGSLIDYLCTSGKLFRIYTYVEGDKAYLECSYYSEFNCSRGGDTETRKVEGYGLVFHYLGSHVREAYGTAYHLNQECFWLFQRRNETPDWMDIRFGDEESSMSLDFDSFFKSFLLVDDPIWVDCRLEDYNASLPYYLISSPDFWHQEWRTRLYRALPCQPKPFVSHGYQTNLYAPYSWENVDYPTADYVVDFVLTGTRTAAVKFSMTIRDSHIVIRSPPQVFALRLPLLMDDLEFFTSRDPGAWLQHFYKRRSRRWFLVRKYWRLTADVMETRRPTTVHDVVQQWPVMHPDYVYTVDSHGDFLLKLATSELARDPDTQEPIHSQQITDKQSWVVILHGANQNRART